MSQYQMLINGKLVPGEQKLPVLNPATEEIVALCPRASAEQFDEAVAAAKEAFPAWSRTPLEERGALLIKVAEVIEINSNELACVLTSEQGKPLENAKSEVRCMSDFFRYFANLNLPAKRIGQAEGSDVQLLRRPLGVVAAIITWNFPLSIVGVKVPPALLAGNTIVVKPAPTTPLSTLRFAALIKDILPAGVVNVVTDANNLGHVLTAHPDVRKVSFTGSTETGKKVMASASSTIKRLTLELGGNDAAIVLADADPKAIAQTLFDRAFGNSGQICLAIKRLYVHQSIYDEMCDELARIANHTVVDDGMRPGAQLGPVQNKTQFEKIKGYIKSAYEDGNVIAGGRPLERPGYFIAPTIVRDITDGTRLVDEEQFGPILPVIKYVDLDDAIVRANNSEYALGASIWSSNVAKAREIASRMEAGSIWINTHNDGAPDTPYGGLKQSGIGVELGEEGLAEYTQIQVMSVP
ncbi:aldehyde dehydrogenase family protein [Bradyrhizobium sp. UFLA05-153]